MLTRIAKPIPVVPWVAGRAAPQDLLRGVKTHALHVTVSGAIVVATGGAGNVVADAYSQLIQQFLITESGTPLIDLSGVLFTYLTQRSSRNVSAIVGTGLPAAGSALAAGTYNVSVDFRLDFASIYAAGDPSETALVDSVPGNVRTQMTIIWPTNTNNVIGTANPGNVNFSGLNANAVQEYDTAAGSPPFFLPRIRRGQSAQISGAQTQFPIPFLPDGANRVASVIFRGLTDGFTNDGVFTGNIILKGDATTYIDNVNFQYLLDRQSKYWNFPAPHAGILDCNFRSDGKLSEMYIGGQDQNPRLIAAVTNPGTTTVVEWYTLELESKDGVTTPLIPGM